MKIKDLNLDEKPIERLMLHGAQSLSSTELLAIIIRSGNSHANALDLARELLSNAEGSLSTLAGMSIDNICSVNGIGKGKATGILAALELGKRLFSEGSLLDSGAVTCSMDIFKLLYPKVKSLVHEEFWVIWLGKTSKVIGIDQMSSGGFSSTTIDYRYILKRAIEKNAASIIIAHNHPSGSPMPSKADIAETENLKERCISVGIPLLDHIIISEGKYFSFKDETITIPNTKIL